MHMFLIADIKSSVPAIKSSIIFSLKKLKIRYSIFYLCKSCISFIQ